MHARFRLHALVLVSAAALAVAASALAATGTNGALDLGVDALRARMAAVEKGEAPDPETRAQTVAAYAEAIENLESAADWRRRAEALADLQQNLPSLLEKARRELDAWSPSPEKAPDASLALDALEARASEADATLAALRKSLADIEEEQKRLAERRAALPAELADAVLGREGSLGELALPPPPAGTAELSRAKRAASLAREKLAAARSEALEFELATFESRRELVAAKRDALRRRLESLGERTALLQAAVTERRKLEAEKAAEKALEEQAALAEIHPVLGALAAENVSLAAERVGEGGFAVRSEKALRSLDSLHARVQALEDRASSVRQKVEAAGLTDAIGLLLRKELDELPDVEAIRTEIRARAAKISDVQLRALGYEELRADLPSIDAEVEDILAGRAGEIDEGLAAKAASAARAVVRTRREALDALIRDANGYFATLVDLDAKQRQFVRAVEDFSAYLEQNVLWIPNASLSGVLAVSKWPAALAWLASPDNLGKVGERLGATLRFAPIRSLLALLLLAAAVALRPRARRTVLGLCTDARTDGDDFLLRSTTAFFLAALLAAVGPFALVVLSWMLSAAPLALDDFTRALAVALRDIAAPLFSLEFLRRTCRRGGPASAFLGWREAPLAAVRRQASLIEAISVPCFFVAAFFDAQPDAAWSAGLGRVAFLAGLAVVAVSSVRLLRPHGEVAHQLASRARLEDLGVAEHRLYLVPAVVGSLVAAIALLGYYYTAIVLMQRLWLTVVVAALAAIGHTVLSRWLAVLAARRAAAAAGDEDARDEDESLETAGSQTRSLLRGAFVVAAFAALFVVWADVFPALRFFERVELYAVTVPVEAVGESGVTTTIDTPIPVTAANLMLALLGLVVAVFGARNLPGLLEVAVLSRTRLDVGARYAVVTVSRYVLATVGVVIALLNLGVQWSSVQWLVAAVSVGLGFGLQEIFSNFVSGLILLVERPVRVGDTVTVGDFTGTVTKIRIRATTIVDWDLKELIIPNTQFITSHLVNWSLSDATLRLVLPVGVAYGSDTAKVERLLYEAAKESPQVLEDPTPVVLFVAFGESSLDFELRCFVTGPRALITARHALLMEIDRKFRASGVEIPFPQRDLHLRTASERAASTLRGEAPAAGRSPA